MYYIQNDGLMRDAKRTELESAVARMIIARIKAEFIGGKLQIMRMIAVIASLCALMIPYASASYTMPFFERKLSVGLIGIIQSFGNGLAVLVPKLLGSTLFAAGTRNAVIAAAFMLVITIINLLIFAAFFLGFLNLTSAAKFMKNASLVGAAAALAGQIAVIIMKMTFSDAAGSGFSPGFGAIVSAVLFAVIYYINRSLLKKGIEPEYRENDLKRKEMLKKVRKGEINLDDLPVPIFESEEEHKERMKALEEALKAEEEGKEL
ncbi:MAG: hypothetical protein K6F64_02355 [Clostridia bacterium]|nr:hypothetical protein [Clostridia bacterium]